MTYSVRMDTYLIADIGATHARFALTGEELTRPSGEVVVLPTGSFTDAVSMVGRALDALGTPACTDACFAVAGPVTDGRAQITNGGLAFSEQELAEHFDMGVYLVNDFFAVAAGVPHLMHLQRIGGSETPPDPTGIRAVLGPGSGLGMGILVPEAEGEWRVLASEGGHADLAPGSHLELELLNHLMAEHGAVCWETVVSGPGLVNLYRAVSRMWGSEPRQLAPEEISALGVEADDPVCHQTLELFFGFLGAAAGNLALTVCARGGVYIAGGIAPALAEFAAASPLRRRFDERAELEHLVRDIPLYLILDENPGLVGAARCLEAVRRRRG
jgi:glucokinase